MTKPSFTVPVADIERGPRTVNFTLDEAWLTTALEGTEAVPRRAGTATVELSKSGKDVMIRGRVEAPLSMPCVVTLDPLDIDVSTEIFLMLAPATSEVSTKTTKNGRVDPAKDGKDAPAEARGAGSRRRAAKDEEEEGELLEERAAARDTYEGSQIELDPFFREFIVLELPMFPRRSDLPSSEGPAIGSPPADPGEQE
ncbi:MAG: hypothetical protein ABI488_10900, partial [Polyangiaceae bacterium]